MNGYSDCGNAANFTDKELLNAFENLLSEIEPNHLFVGTINPEIIKGAINAIKYKIEPETANRGKWKHKDGINFYFCNVCGSGNNNGGGIKTKFCPNCGVRMETGATNE